MGAGEITLISTLGTAFLGLMTAVLIELIRNRRQRTDVDRKVTTLVAEVTPNGGASLKDAVERIEIDVREMRLEQNRQGQHIAAVEARVSDHLLLHQRDG